MNDMTWVGEVVLYLLAVLGAKTLFGFRFPWEVQVKAKRELRRWLDERFNKETLMHAEYKRAVELLNQL